MEQDDPAMLRGAPLGWWFPLIFLYNCLFPLAGVLGFFVPGIPHVALRLLLGIGGPLLSATIGYFLLRAGLRGRARVARFRELLACPRCSAQVLEVDERGGAGHSRSSRGSFSYVKLWVRLHAEIPSAVIWQRELAGEACYERREVEQMSRGARCIVAVDPRTHEFVIVPGTIQPPAQHLPPAPGPSPVFMT